jgi:GTP1/Obg family GTP-binding protein
MTYSDCFTNEQLHHALAKAVAERDEARKEKEKWGLYAERVERERDHYKQAIEEISTTIQDWLDSIVQEPSLDFIHAIKTWADKKLKEI